MRLSEHPDFEQLILNAAEHFRGRGIRPSFIEKDYYVTEALRAISAHAGDTVIFKGGTSLSKGWNLIERFSEDIDLFLDPEAFKPALGTNATDRELKRLKAAVAAHPALNFLPGESKTFGGSGRSDRFSYVQLFGGPGELVNQVLLESGTASGRQPSINLPLRSLVSQFLHETGRSLNATDEATFSMRLLHFRRTFVEKLFAIHGKIELLVKRDGKPLGSYARHYYDLYILAGQPEVLAMLKSNEYARIKEDYNLISREHFPRDYVAPSDMSFARSDALFPQGELGRTIAKEYEKQCRQLCFGAYPTWDEISERFAALRSLL